MFQNRSKRYLKTVSNSDDKTISAMNNFMQLILDYQLKLSVGDIWFWNGIPDWKVNTLNTYCRKMIQWLGLFPQLAIAFLFNRIGKGSRKGNPPIHIYPLYSNFIHYPKMTFHTPMYCPNHHTGTYTPPLYLSSILICHIIRYPNISGCFFIKKHNSNTTTTPYFTIFTCITITHCL